MSMAKCPRLPTGKVREIIAKTVESGNEHGFVVCNDGSTSSVIEGGEDAMRIDKALGECNLEDGPVDVFHTHPNGVDQLSDTDRKAAAHDKIQSVCVAVEGGDVRCESVESCEREVAAE